MATASCTADQVAFERLDEHTRAHYGSARGREEASAARGLSRGERAIFERLPAAGAVLDVGCGGGRVALALARTGRTVTGLDRDAGLLRLAKAAAVERGVELTLVEGDARRLPFPDRSFDGALFSGNGIGHLGPEAKRAALRELARVTRGGGVVVVPFRTPYAVNRLLPRMLARRAGAFLGRAQHGLGRDEGLEAHGYVHRPGHRALLRTAVEAGLRPLALASELAAGRRIPLGPLTPYVGGQFYLVAEPA